MKRTEDSLRDLWDNAPKIKFIGVQVEEKNKAYGRERKERHNRYAKLNRAR